MEIIFPSAIPLLVEKIKKGATLIFPTETSYGLGCDATNQTAVNRIFAIKGRDPNKPLLIVVPSVEIAKQYLVWNDTLEKIAEKYWPGPLTIVGQGGLQTLPPGILAADGTIAIRVTADPWLEKFTTLLGRPLVATSANLAGHTELYDPADIIKHFSTASEQPDFLVDGGVLPKNPPTTIVRIAGEDLQILRRGAVDVQL